MALVAINAPQRYRALPGTKFTSEHLLYCPVQKAQSLGSLRLRREKHLTLNQ